MPPPDTRLGNFAVESGSEAARNNLDKELTVIALLKNDDAGKLVLRLTLGVLMLFHGVAKILNPGSLNYIAGQLNHAGLPEFLVYGVFIGEVMAALLLIAGIYCRYAGLIIVINMLFAIGLVHMEHLFLLTPNGGWRLELQAFYLFGGLTVALLGSGRFAFKRD